MTNRSKTSFIEDHEEELAKQRVIEQLGFEPPRPCGWQIVVAVHIRPEEISTFVDDKGNKISIIRPEAVIQLDKWNSCSGLVIAVGPYAYQGKKMFEEIGPAVKVGDFVVFPRHEGLQLNYRNKPIQVFPDDRCLLVVEDPNYVTRD